MVQVFSRQSMAQSWVGVQLRVQEIVSGVGRVQFVVQGPVEQVGLQPGVASQ
jgi:hypothetical protein